MGLRAILFGADLKLEIDLPEIDLSYFEDANFNPASIDEQGKLDEKKIWRRRR